MIRDLLRYFMLFIALIMAQLLIFNNIEFSGFINPYIYILFVLLLPFYAPSFVLLVSTFLMGITIDIFLGTPGVHSTATVLAAFSRPAVMRLFSPREGYQSGTFPRLSQFGFEWFAKYTVMLVIIHHFSLFYLEVYTLHHFFATFFRALLSTLFTSLLLIGSQYFIFRR